MKKILVLMLFLNLILYCQIKQHPDNPHYFQYKDQPTILVASGEHYGSVINKAFDYDLYLKTLKNIGLNHTRIFLGDYLENSGAFCIETNTLAVICKGGKITIPLYFLCKI